tara:strand:- start:4639 stop:5448 length:810 start_codon:yes stop_codon:yes gene_type:complete
MPDEFHGAIIQLCSVLDYEKNLTKIKGFIREAKKNGAENIFLPEVFYSMSDGRKPTPHLLSPGNEHEENVLNLAMENKVNLIGGSCATNIGGKIFNRAYVINKNGEIVNTYDKKHLFKCCFENKKESKVINIDEGRIYSKGLESEVYSVDDVWKIGLSICFDLRFSSHFCQLTKMGANLLCCPSAFTKKTGALHWHILNKARAIESQSYVVSAAQVGKNNSSVNTFGHSLVVDPMGKVLVDLGGEKEGVANFTLKKSAIIEARSQIMMD